MSTFKVSVENIKEVKEHKNAEKLSLALLDKIDWQFVIRKEEFKAGDSIVFFPIDSVLPVNLADYLNIRNFLAGANKDRIKAARLRGEMSFGFITSPDTIKKYLIENGKLVEETLPVDLTELLEVTKYEEPIPIQYAGMIRARDERFIRYTDIENIRNFPNLIAEGEEVILTEKLHGTNARFLCVTDEKGVNDFFCGSHNISLQESNANVYWRAAQENELLLMLARNPFYEVFGEIIGVQDLKYGIPTGRIGLRVFDVYDVKAGKYLDYDEYVEFCQKNNLETVPFVYRGVFNVEVINAFKSGSSALDSHIREGVVIRLAKERMDSAVGRVILKAISDDYLMRKGGTENH